MLTKISVRRKSIKDLNGLKNTQLYVRQYFGSAIKDANLKSAHIP